MKQLPWLAAVAALALGGGVALAQPAPSNPSPAPNPAPPASPSPAAPAAAAKPSAPVVTPAIIDHSASATSPPFRLTVWPDGRCEYQQFPLGGQTYPLATKLKVLPRYLASQFFVDLNQARPLIQYPTCDQVPDLIFGFQETVQYLGQATPNLGCFGLSPHLGLVAHDVRTIEQYMGVGYSIQL